MARKSDTAKGKTKSANPSKPTQGTSAPGTASAAQPESEPVPETAPAIDPTPAAATPTPEAPAPAIPAETTASPPRPQPSAAEQPSRQPVSVNAQYIKDLSFEVPEAPAIFATMQENSPDISINIDVRAQPLQERRYEVALHVHARCTVVAHTAFILELVYAGLFTVNVPPEHLQPVLLIECPRLIFPFARNIIADTSRDGGFPPLMLGPVDFVAMYQNHLSRKPQANAEARDPAA